MMLSLTNQSCYDDDQIKSIVHSDAQHSVVESYGTFSNMQYNISLSSNTYFVTTFFCVLSCDTLVKIFVTSSLN